MKEVALQLTWLEIFFVTTTIVSLFFNLKQWRDRKNLLQPISSALVALFNDIKGKSNHAYLTQLLVYNNPENPHTDLATLKLDYAQFTQTVIQSLQGFQEAVVGLLVTINPKDKEGKEAFRATEYGLTEQEKKLREEQLERMRVRQPLDVGEATALQDFASRATPQQHKQKLLKESQELISAVKTTEPGKNLREEAVIVEELVFRKLEAETGKTIDRKVIIRTKKGEFQLDGVLTRAKRDISVIEVKLIPGKTLEPHRLQPVFEAAVDARSQIIQSRGPETKFSLIIVLVTKEEQDLSDLEGIQQYASQFGIEVEIRTFSVKVLKEEFGVSG